MIKLIYAEIDKERRKSEKLLLNILPKKVIKELKEKGNTSPEFFKNVTVLFSDIVGFTDISTKMPLTGRMVYSEELHDVRPGQVQLINTLNLKEGMYLLQLTSGENSAFRKIVIKR